jgi:SNF2 family DNA or RNA helicase
MKKAVKHLLENACAALFLDPGLRKTSITYAAFTFLQKRKVASKMLVIAPLKACYRVWPAEAAKWKDFNHLRVVVLHGPKKEERLQQDADVYVINPEGLEWLIYGGSGRRALDTRRWRKFGFDTLAIDELTKFKSSKGIRFKALKQVLDTFSRRWGLTGSPAPNGLLDLFGQCFILDMGRTLGRYITHYRAEYFLNPDRQGWNWVLKPGAKERIYDRIKPLALRMAAEDYLELPPIIDVGDKKEERLELPPKARELYDALEEDLIAKIDARIVTAANAASASNKLWQICNGGLYVDQDMASLIAGRASEGRKSEKIHDVKTDWLEDLIEELNGQPLLIGYQFKHDLERLQERFGKDIPVFGANDSKNSIIEAQWNRNELLFCCGQQDAIAHALNLQEGSAAHLAHYSLTWNLETWDQIIRRIRRSGTKAKRVFRYLAVMKDTTDEDRLYSISRKDTTQKSLFEALKARHGR